jgi:hypothetical protein
VAVGCALSAAVGAAAYGVHAHLTREDGPALEAPAPAPAPVVAKRHDRPASVPSIVPNVVPNVVPSFETPSARLRAVSPPPPRLSQADAMRAELYLLRQARAAVAREDFATALPPIAEHARRFKDGRLTEEREALRVKALVGLGRTDEAHRAAASFRTRFPHSVLLPAVGRMSAGQ